MDAMLSRAGVDDEGKELAGPTQVCFTVNGSGSDTRTVFTRSCTVVRSFKIVTKF